MAYGDELGGQMKAEDLVHVGKQINQDVDALGPDFSWRPFEKCEGCGRRLGVYRNDQRYEFYCVRCTYGALWVDTKDRLYSYRTSATN